ncbi:putative sterigmatocystin biosynthesis monooxygenase [Lachnellula arida]|uniref:Putative sterigmatocystin biosynthesis monooxygenase n=1 Tax=Lachnellula arida TaxID=1316785 RepID=A0A8T9BF51_9HELO|nr:putative sterigmatocystin biosynthesis monooxygenase [Lachnellula arida]
MVANNGLKGPGNEVKVAHSVVNGHPEEPALKPIQATAAYKNKNPVAYDLSKQYFDAPRRLKIVVAGAGCSALDLAHQVEIGGLKNIDLQILEKNAGLGGTWYENRYPGCACDIPAHNYLFTWAPNPNWSSFYVSAPEILEYLEDVAEKFHLTKYITTRRKVVGAHWVEEKQKWEVMSRRTDGRRNVISADGVTSGEVGEDLIEECDIFINASGFFNNWRWPNTPGRENYEGTMVHSADYQPSIDLRGKRVAVIGNGSSGIQVTAAVQKLAAQMTVFIRHPTWVTSNMGSRFIPPGKKNFCFDSEQKNKWIENPKEYLDYRKEVEKELNFRFPLFIRDTPQQAMAKEFTIKDMKSRLAGKPELQTTLLPDFAVGCRRPTPGTGYLEALCADNTELVWGELESFTKTGIKSAGDGKERDFDVIIAATGFDMSFVPRWPIVGRNGVDLQKEWAKDPACYMSTIAKDMPNYFVYLGPGSPVGHGSLITSIERITLYICDIVTKLQRENYTSFTLKPGKVEAYQSQMMAWLDKTVWGDSCQSSFKNGTVTGALNAFHPGSRLHYFELLRRHRYEDFDWTSGCPEPEFDYAWFNNGFLSHELETDVTADPTWYLDQEDTILSAFQGEVGA